MRFVYCLFVGVLISGCAGLKNTPQQEAVLTAYGQCEAEGRVSNNITLTRVEPDGNYWIETRNGNAGVGELFTCMRERLRAAGR